MSKITFAETAWEEYLYWQTQDKKTLKKVNQLLKDITRNAFDGIGKPEPLKIMVDFGADESTTATDLYIRTCLHKM